MNDSPAATAPETGLSGSRWWVACVIVFVGSLGATAPTTGDFGVTWDEPAYRFSQQRSAEWWRRVGQVRSRADLDALVAPDALLFYWTYARHGVNFHPPLAGQLNLLTHACFGRWVKDVPSRRLSSVIEYALTVTIGFGFLSRRYGVWVGLVAAGSLLFMPRVYGDAHLATTDPPGLLLWAATSVAFWDGLHRPNGRGWRVLFGVLLGLAFVEKMAAVFVLAPVLLWLAVDRLPRSFRRETWRADWTDGLATTGAMLLPLALSFAEILRLTRQFPEPKRTNLFLEHPATFLPGAILAVPMLVWLLRRAVGRAFPGGAVWGVERPGLETWTALLAFAPVVGWLGNPAWWREALPRLAHYYMLNTDRQGSLEPIRIYYLGVTYEYSLPWHNGWVLIAVTVPAAVLVASAFGLIYALKVVRSDRLPLYFLAHFLTIPLIRMLPTPAHDGVRLMLPTFFFLAGFAGWGAVWLADGLAWALRVKSPSAPRAVVAALVLAPSAWQLVKVHPYELSYYNEWVGGPSGASKAGFELTYWYDAFNPETIAELNARLPREAPVDFLNDLAKTSTFFELQSLGELRRDVGVSGMRTQDVIPYVWLLSHESKAVPFTRLLFAMAPWYTRRVDGLRVLTVADPVAVTRAWALSMMLDARDETPPARPRTPRWVHKYAPFLARFWGEGVTRVARQGVSEDVLEWARDDPRGFLRAAEILARDKDAGDDPGANRLLIAMSRASKRGPFYRTALRSRPEAIVEAARIVIDRQAALRAVLTRYGYTDPDTIDGPLDRGLPPTQP